MSLPDPASERFELPLTVAEADIDQLGHVNNVVYLRWVQEAATAHWQTAATPADQAEVAWVVLRHEIDYKHPARLGEALIARTWVGAATSNTFERHTEIVRGKEARVLARARTLWCPISRKSGRPIRVSAEVRRRFSLAP